MQITSALAKNLDLSSLVKRSEKTESTDGQSSPKVSSVSSAIQDAALRKILSRYNVREITPTGFSEMLQSLRKSGAISDAQYQELSTIRTELDAQGVKADEEIDLVQFCSKLLKDAREDDASSSQINSMERQLQWLQKAAQIQSTSGSSGLDSLA